MQCFNVATAYTAWRAIALGEPVFAHRHRHRQRRTAAQLGSAARHADRRTSSRSADAEADTDRYMMGGPMMGFEIPGRRARSSRPPTA